MIGRLRGIILEKQPPLMLLEVAGVGYEVQMPVSCFYQLPAQGEEIIILTHLVVREDVHLLYGFNDKQERLLFRELIKVSGIGPRLALAILSGMSAQQFVNAVESEEILALTQLPGVGKKTAERLVVEMKGSLRLLYGSCRDASPDILRPAILASVVPDKQSEMQAASALVSLGYKPQEASRLISKIAREGADCETLIRDALRVAL